MATVVSRFAKDPVGFIKRVLYKTTIGAIKYGRADGYDAARYWQDRFSRYGRSIKGPGDEGLSEGENEKMYAEAAEVFFALCKKEGIDFTKSTVLEIGCGNGFYTQLLKDAGVKSYTGIDIADALFPDFNNRFPAFKFIKKDITDDTINGTYDVIIMVDVIQHIVNDAKLTHAFENVKRCLGANGVFILSAISEVHKRRLFYVQAWMLEDIKQRFVGYSLGDVVPFRESAIVAIRKN
jgi:SAM-dependent methyltransferase